MVPGATLCHGLMTLLSLALASESAQRTPLTSWSLAPLSATGGGDLASISLPSFIPGPTWGAATVPCTVLACQLQQGLYPGLFQDLNIYSVNTSAYDEVWVYATQFTAPAAALVPGAALGLSFEGFNYRGEVYMNGARVADNATLVGAFSRLRFDVTDLVRAGANGLAVALQRPVDRGLDKTPSDTDLAITFVDWAPQQPDSNMGLWQPVVLESTPGAVLVLDPLLNTVLDANLSAATVQLGATLRNVGAAAAQVLLAADLLAPDGRRWAANSTFSIPARSELLALLPNISLATPALWWPYELSGADPALHTLTLTASVGGAPSDALTKRVGVREMTRDGDTDGLVINGVPLLIRGGGWAPDLLLRYSPERTRKELAYVRDMGLNAIRLEGKMNDDDFFTQTDAMGILVLPGWCCCDAWQHWPAWQAEQYAVAAASMRTQARRFRASASVAVFLISSDEVPPANVQALFLDSIAAEAWATPTYRSAGSDGVKMRGPYSWVAPSYWAQDAALPPHAGSAVGGAWGFNTEGGPGQAPMTEASLRRTITNTSALWPPAPNSGWGHAGAQGGNFHDLDRFNAPLAARYGSAGDLSTYLALAAAQEYEGFRAMFEAFARNKPQLWSKAHSLQPATGMVQWMLNSAWPSNVWNLYDYYLVPSAAYASVKKACGEALHAMLAYDDESVWVTNARAAPAGGAGSAVLVEAFSTTGAPLFNATYAVPALGASGGARVGAGPSRAAMRTALGPNRTYFARLTLLDGSGAPLSAPNTYALATDSDVIDWASSTWYDTGCSSYANLQELRTLPAVALGVAPVPLSPGATRVDLALPAGAPAVAFFARARLVDALGADVAPAHYSDNYITLRPGEGASITISYNSADVAHPPTAVIVTTFNAEAGARSSGA